MRSACPLDCPDTCKLEVTVEDGRVQALDGDRADPFTAGFICSKVRDFPEHMYGSDRILHPMIRTGIKGEGRFERIGWEQALDLAAAKLREVSQRSGGEAILPYNYGGSNGLLSDGGVDARLFRRLGASRLLRTLCAAATTAAAQGLYGRMPGVALEDYVHAKLIVIWGANPSATSIHLVPVIKEARRRGARLVVIDPRRIPLASNADLHLAIRPGTDLPVALSLIRWLFESGAADTAFLAEHATGAAQLRERASSWSFERAAETAGVSAADLEALARLYAESSPAVIRCGWGVERNRNGAHGIAAVLALPAVAGKFGVRGGGFTMSQSRAVGVAAAPSAAADEASTRTINMCLLGEALQTTRDPRIELLFVYNANPVATAPAQHKVLAGLAREDLYTIVHEQVMTDTCQWADLILPATTFLEHRELKNSYGAIRLFDSPPVVAPVGEARPNHQLFLELCDRLELSREGDPRTPEELVDRILLSVHDGERMRAELAESGSASPPGGSRPLPFTDHRPPTPSGKIELVPEALDKASAAGMYGFLPLLRSERHPLQLISPATPHTISSTFGQLAKPAPLEIHPRTAAARGIADGARVRVHNDQAEVVCFARLDADQREDVVCLPKGLWRKHTQNGLTAAALAPDHVTDLGGQGCFNDAFVEVSLIG